MLTIRKFAVPLPTPYANVYFKIPLPRDAEILKVAMHRGSPQLWVLLDPDQNTTARRFTLVPTGGEIDEGARLFYVDTLFLSDGALVFHLFEEVAE